MADYGGYQSNVRGNELDTEVVLGGTNPVEFAMGLMNRAFQEQQATQNRKLEYARMNQEAAMERQRQANESEAYAQQQEERDFNRALQLVQAGVKPQDAFAAAPRTPGNRFPVLDAIYKQGQEKKKAEDAEKEQAQVRGFIPAAVGGLAGLPPDLQQQALSGLSEKAGLPQEILGLNVLSEIARQKQADEKEAAANQRASIRANATRDNAAATREATQANRDIQHTTQLRKEFNGLSKDFLKQKDGYTRVLSSAKNPTAAGDLALIFNYMKVLDPNSVVRESEFATAAAAGDYGDRIAGYVNRIQNGQRLSKAQRADFVDRSNKLFHDAAKNQRKLERRYRQLGKKAGLDPSQTATDFIGKLYRTSGVDIVPAPPTSEPGASFVEMKNGVPVFQRPDGSFFMDTGTKQ
jgi:hypothetical protein